MAGEGGTGVIRAYAMSIAWEQVAHWRNDGVTAEQAKEVLELVTTDWAAIASHLAMMWIELKEEQFVKFATDGLKSAA